MTSEEAIKTISKMLAVTDLTVRGNMTSKMVEACRMAIKALEQVSVLDKIKVEIELRNSAAYMGEYNVGLRDALKVINKYTAEQGASEHGFHTCKYEEYEQKANESSGAIYKGLNLRFKEGGYT